MTKKPYAKTLIMGTVRKTITVTEKHDDSQFLNLKSKIDKGLESGLSSKIVEEIWDAGKKRLKKIRSVKMLGIQISCEAENDLGTHL